MRRTFTGTSLVALMLGIGVAIAQTPAPGGSGGEPQRPGRSETQGQPSPRGPDRAQSPAERGTPQQAQPQRGQQAPPTRAQSPAERGTPQQAQPQRGQEAPPSRAQTPSDRGSPQQAQPGMRDGQQDRSPSRAQTPPDRSSPQQAQPGRRDGQQQRGAQGQQRDDATVTGSIQSNPEQATRLRQSVEQARVPEARVNVNVRVGANLPRNVTLVAPPPALIEIAPRYRDYRVVRVRDQLVIVDPGTYRVVEVVRISGGRTGQVRGSLTLTTEQQQIVRRYARQRAGSRVTVDVREGRPLGREVELHELPEEVFVEVPELREYRYVVSGNQIILVDPSTRVVAEVIR
jgi:hypothetical protein